MIDLKLEALFISEILRIVHNNYESVPMFKLKQE